MLLLFSTLNCFLHFSSDENVFYAGLIIKNNTLYFLVKSLGYQTPAHHLAKTLNTCAIGFNISKGICQILAYVNALEKIFDKYI